MIRLDCTRPARVRILRCSLAVGLADVELGGDQHPVLLVSDAAIQRAQARLWSVLRVVAEPGAAAPLAALLERRYVPGPGERVGILVSGGNSTAVDFGRSASDVGQEREAPHAVESRAILSEDR